MLDALNWENFIFNLIDVIFDVMHVLPNVNATHGQDSQLLKCPLVLLKNSKCKCSTGSSIFPTRCSLVPKTNDLLSNVQEGQNDVDTMSYHQLSNPHTAVHAWAVIQDNYLSALLLFNRPSIWLRVKLRWQDLNIREFLIDIWILASLSSLCSHWPSIQLLQTCR